MRHDRVVHLGRRHQLAGDVGAGQALTHVYGVTGRLDQMSIVQ